MLRISDNEELFKAVAKALSKNTKKYNAYIESGQIHEDDLKKVKRLKIRCRKLDGIEKLTSLTALDAYYVPLDNVENYADTIGRLTNLYKLKLIGDHNMQIDLGNNPKLKTILISGENYSVSGVENLECINNRKGKLNLMLAGNTMLYNMKEFISRATKKNTKKIILPLSVYAAETNTNPDISEVLNQSTANIRFQSYRVLDYMSVKETIEFNNAISQIKRELALQERDIEGKILKTYEYICRNFEFAEKEYSSERKSYSIKNDPIRSSKTVLKSKRGVCVAFSNIFNYILQSEGIKALPVHGSLRGGEGHQLSRVCIGEDKWAYFDPTYGISPENSVDWRCYHMSRQKVGKYCELMETECKYNSDESMLWPELKEKIAFEEQPDFVRKAKTKEIISPSRQVTPIKSVAPKIKKDNLEV